MMQGKLVAVTTSAVGSEVVEVLPGGVVVFNAAPFEESGGAVLVGGVERPYMAADPEVDALTMVDTTGISPGDFLAITPARQVTEATVRVDDLGQEPVVAAVPRDKNLSITEGVRDNPDDQETVLLKWEGSSLVVDHVVGMAPVVNAPVGVMGSDGTQSGLSGDGYFTGVRASFSDGADFRGKDLFGTWRGYGVAPGHFDDLPWGPVPGGFRDTRLAAGDKAHLFESIYLKLAVNLLAGRRYRISGKLRALVLDADGVLRTRLRMAQGATDPTTSGDNELDVDTTGKVYTSGIQMPGLVEDTLSPTVSGQYRFALTYQGLNGSRSAARYGRILVEDVGPAAVQVGGEEDGITRVLYQSTWRATASRLYDKTGAAISGRDGDIDLWYWNGEPVNYWSSAWLYGGGAVESDNASELGKDMPTALTGATIHKSEIYIRNKMWWADTGRGGRIVLSSLSGDTLPSTKIIDSTFWGGVLSAGAGAWIEVPTSWFTNGANLGVCMGDNDGRGRDGSNTLFNLDSGAFHGIDDADPPLVRHTYSR